MRVIFRLVMPSLALVALLSCLGCDADPDETTTPSDSKVVINEVLHKSIDDTADWVELYNFGSDEVDLSGWVLKDEKDDHVFTIPEGTTLAGGDFLVIEGKEGTGELVADFGFSSDDEARLFDSSGTLVDTCDWLEGQAPMGLTFGRIPDGTGDFVELTVPTPGAPNDE